MDLGTLQIHILQVKPGLIAVFCELFIRFLIAVSNLCFMYQASQFQQPHFKKMTVSSLRKRGHILVLSPLNLKKLSFTFLLQPLLFSLPQSPISCLRRKKNAMFALHSKILILFRIQVSIFIKPSYKLFPNQSF